MVKALCIHPAGTRNCTIHLKYLALTVLNISDFVAECESIQYLKYLFQVSEIFSTELLNVTVEL